MKEFDLDPEIDAFIEKYIEVAESIMRPWSGISVILTRQA
jgi:hypothetical protein